MLKNAIDKLRKKIIHSLGGHTEEVRVPVAQAIFPTEYLLQHVHASAEYPVKRLPPDDYFVCQVAQGTAQELMARHIIGYTIDNVKDHIILKGRITIIKNLREGETDDAETALEEIRVQTSRS